MSRTIGLRDAVNALVERHGGVRLAARALRIDHAYLYRLKSGEKDNPTDDVLRKLGLRRVVSYEPIRPMRTVLVHGGESLEMKP